MTWRQLKQNEVIKNVVLESKVVSIESVDETARECEERLGGQRADFPQVYSETGFSPWCYEVKVSSGSCVEDEVSSNSPLIFCSVLGRAKKYNKFVVPFAWYEIGQWGCERYCDERERKRDIEIFEINRGYEMLVQSLDIERGEKIDLPWEIKIDDYFDDAVVDDKHLPNDVIDIVEEYNDKYRYGEPYMTSIF